MRHEHDAMLLVRAELCDRLDTLSKLSRRASPSDFTARIETIRTLAAAYGMTPVVRLAEALERAVSAADRPGHATCHTDLYLACLQDAIGCEKADDRTSEALLASVSVRLGA